MRRNLEIIFALLVGIFVGVASYGSYKSHDYHMTTQNPEPIREYIYIEKEPEVIRDTEYVYIESEPVIEYIHVTDEFYRNFTTEEEWYYKDLAMREGESEGVVGMLWLMYTAECRCEAFNHSIKEEWSSSAYTSMSRTGITPNEDCNKAFELFREGWTPRPLYFRADHYHTFGMALCQVGNHYFSY